MQLLVLNIFIYIAAFESTVRNI